MEYLYSASKFIRLINKSLKAGDIYSGRTNDPDFTFLSTSHNAVLYSSNGPFPISIAYKQHPILHKSTFFPYGY